MRPAIELRTIAAVTALAVREVVDAAALTGWGSEAFDALAAALEVTGLIAAGPYGGLFLGDFFELERSEVTAFVPIEANTRRSRRPPGLDPAGSTTTASRSRPSRRRSRCTRARSKIDRTYAAVGEVVAERAIGTSGPIREYFLVSSADTDDVARHRTEVCWPVFRTGAA